ncbi:MAG: BLUF domain-containing protein [Anaerolineae bacterium]|nr:BLUF domain-containing protein [Anaerolineae bacterium]
MGLISLVYVSFESRRMTSEDLQSILNKARTFNSEHQITGMLLYRTGYFIQALEGEEADVMALYEKIARDDRHRHVLMIYKGPIEQRAFGNWTMGFKNLDNLTPADLPGYTDFLSREITPELMTNNVSRALAFLESFKEEANY